MITDGTSTDLSQQRLQPTADDGSTPLPQQPPLITPATQQPQSATTQVAGQTAPSATPSDSSPASAPPAQIADAAGAGTGADPNQSPSSTASDLPASQPTTAATPSASSVPPAIAPSATPAATDGQGSIAAFDAYDPLANMTEEQKDLYWAGQGAPISGAGTPLAAQLGTNIAPGTPGASSFSTPQAAQGYQSALNNLVSGNSSQIADLTNQVQGGTQAAQNAANAGITAQNATNSANDYNSYISNLQSTNADPSTYPTLQQWQASMGQPVAPVATPGATPGSPPLITPSGAASASTGAIAPAQLAQVAATAGVGASAPPAITPSGSATDINGSVPAGAAGTGIAPTTGTSGPATGVASSTIDPNSDLRSQVLTPGNDPRLTGIQGQVDQAANNVGNIDRTALAEQEFNTMNSATQPAYDLALREATQKAAANGQLGSGMLNTSYGDLALQREQELDNEKNALIQNATQGSIQDALNKEGVLSGLEGQVYGEGQTNLQDLQQQQGFEQGANQQSIDNALQQYLTELYGQNQGFNQGLEELGVGSQGNPAATYLEGASAYGGMTPAQLAAVSSSIGANSTGYPSVGYPSNYYPSLGG